MARFLTSDSPLDRMLTHDLAGRIQYGSFLHVVMLGFFTFGTESGRHRHFEALLFLCLLTFTGLARFLAATRRLPYGDSGPVPAAANARVFEAYIVHTTVWTMYVAHIFYSCFGNMVAESIMVVCVAGVTSSGTNVLSSSRPLAYFHLLPQMLVGIVWSFWARDHYGWLIVVVMVVYTVWEMGMTEIQCRHAISTFQAQITLKENGEELRKARDAAEESSAARSRFLANMSHEIRTPLNGLLGLAQILRDDLQGDQHQRTEMFDTMIKSGDHLRSIVDDILDYSKLMAGRMDIEQVAVDLPRLVRESADSLAPMARSKGLHFAVLIAEDVPATVLGDPVRLRQILLNLLSNSIKFTSEGEVEVSVGLGDTAGRVRVTVRDTGIGMSADGLLMLFRDFTQIDASTKRRFGGTGLGLVITKQLVENLGGTIVVESVLGAGSRFVVEIPLVACASVSLPIVTNADCRLPASFRILVAEDNAVNRRIAEVMLKQTGASLDMVEDGAAAVRQHRESPYDLIFMDCNMPEMDGFEATAAIRGLVGEASKVPIIALTANALSEDRQRCLDAGMTDHLPKPVRREDLHDMLRRHVLLSLIRPDSDHAAETDDATHVQL